MNKLTIGLATFVAVVLGLTIAFLPPDNPLGQGEAFLQGSDGEVHSPGLHIQNELDLAILLSALESTDVEDEFETQFTNGYKCRFFGFAKASTASNGDRTYYGCFAFKGSSSTVQSLKITYEYDSTSGADPTIPADEVTHRTYTPTNPNDMDDIILADQVSFDFLINVLTTPPQEVTAALAGRDLKELWIERQQGGGEDKVLLYLKYIGGESNMTLKLVADHLGSSTFGPVTVN